MNLQGKINLIKAAKDAIKSAIIAMGVVPSGNISTYANAITQIDTVKNTDLTVNPSTTSQTLRPSGEYTGYSVVNVNPVTASIDSNIVASNIKTGVEILGVTGEVDELIGQTKTITKNGVYTPDNGYTGFTSITVNTPIVGVNREIKNGVYQMPTSNFTFYIPDNVRNLGYRALKHAFDSCTGLTSVDLSSLIVIYTGEAMSYAFNGCTNLTSVDLSSLTTIEGSQAMSYAFNGCTNLTSVDLSSLTALNMESIMERTFQGCTGLTSVDLSNLTTVYGSKVMSYAFKDCTGLTSVDLSNLTTVYGSQAMSYAFQGCTNLTTLSFPKLKSTSFDTQNNQFHYMLYRVTGCTVHFPSNLQSVIGSLADVQNGFGGTNTTVLFDLPATT